MKKKYKRTVFGLVPNQWKNYNYNLYLFSLTTFGIDVSACVSFTNSWYLRTWFRLYGGPFYGWPFTYLNSVNISEIHDNKLAFFLLRIYIIYAITFFLNLFACKAIHFFFKFPFKKVWSHKHRGFLCSRNCI